MSRGAKTRTKNSKNLRRQKQRAGVATAALVTAAMGATVTLGAGQAAAIDFGPLAECAGGSGMATGNVDCTVSIDPPIAGLLPALGLPIDLNSTAAAREDLRLPILDTLILGGTDAKISGLGLAYANSQFASAGSTAEANAWGFLSAAVAVNLPQFNFSQNPGTTKATSLPLGVTIAFAGAGDASALAFGGFATAIGDVPFGLVENVNCMAIFAQASHSDVGSCTGLLFIFSVSQEAGSPEYVLAIADPTSFKLFNDGSGLIPLPIPSFDRDILRIGIGGPSGVRVESDLVPTSRLSSTTVSARTAVEPVFTALGGSDEPDQVSLVAPADEPAVDDVPVTDEASSPTEYVGKHRAPEAGTGSTDAADATDAEPESDVESDAQWTEPDTQTPSGPETTDTETPDAETPDTETPDTA